VDNTSSTFVGDYVVDIPQHREKPTVTRKRDWYLNGITRGGLARWTEDIKLGKRNVVACDLGARLDGNDLEADEPALGQFSISDHFVSIPLVMGAFHIFVECSIFGSATCVTQTMEGGGNSVK
jgi:hypothetical protein